MLTWYLAVMGYEQGAFAVALIGTVFFIVKLGLQMAGIGGDVDADADGDAGDADGDGDAGDADGDGDAGDADGDGSAENGGNNVPATVDTLHLFTIHGIALGIGFGGWSALGIYKMMGSGIIATAIALVIAFAAMFIHAKTMRALLKLQEVPEVNLKDAIGQIGEVYLTIPKYGDGYGKVNLVLNEALKDYDAMSRDDAPIPSGSKVRVMEVNEDGIFVVQRQSEEDV